MDILTPELWFLHSFKFKGLCSEELSKLTLIQAQPIYDRDIKTDSNYISTEIVLIKLIFVVFINLIIDRLRSRPILIM